jgi:hypothetical protein
VRAAFACIAVLFAAPTLAQKPTKDELAILATSPETISRRLSITDDPMNTFIVVSTEPVLRIKRSVFKVVRDDQFIIASIDRKTRNVTYAVRFWLNHSGYLYLNSVNIETAEGPVRLSIDRGNSDLRGCGVQGCLSVSDFQISVPEAVLRWVASAASAGRMQSWKLRFSSNLGNADYQMPTSEVAGLLIAIDHLNKTPAGSD